MLKQEFRKLISGIEALEHALIMGSSFQLPIQLPKYVSEYNRLLEEAQRRYPNDSFIQTNTPVRYNYQPLFNDSAQVAKIIKTNCRSIIESLSSMTNSQPQHSSQPQINITIGSLQGNFSFDNLVSTIQNSNIGNSTEVIQHITEFRQELNNPEPDRKKLRDIIDSVQNVGEGVVSALLVEVGKKVLGL